MRRHAFIALLALAAGPAAAVIAAVHRAASANDLRALLRMMPKDFVSSFGGDGGPDEALALWVEKRTALRRLAVVTACACAYQRPDYVECPRNAGIAYRAGFERRHGQWVFVSFVEGD